MEKEELLKQIYTNLGVVDCYIKDGGLGFNLVNKSMDFNVVIPEHIYKTLLEIRGKTDETGVEYPFAMVGNLGDINGEIYVCVSLVMTCYDGNVNNGHVKTSDDFNKWLSERINDYSFCILCHTHPKYEKTTFDKSIFDTVKKNNGSKFCLRNIGMNISNSDILQLIGLKLEQRNINNNIYFLQGISLPNGEFNILDIEFDDNNPTLCSVHNVYRIYEDKLIPVNNIWNSKGKKKVIN